MNKCQKGEIYYASLKPIIGSEEGGVRPVLVIQNNKGSRNSNTILIAPLTKKINRKFYIPSHVYINADKNLEYDSIILVEHTRSIDKSRIGNYITTISKKQKIQVELSIVNTFDLNIKEIMKYGI